MLILIKMILKQLFMSELWLGVIDISNIVHLKKCKHKNNACSMKFYKIAGMVYARRRKEGNRHKA